MDSKENDNTQLVLSALSLHQLEKGNVYITKCSAPNDSTKFVSLQNGSFSEIVNLIKNYPVFSG